MALLRNYGAFCSRTAIFRFTGVSTRLPVVCNATFTTTQIQCSYHMVNNKIRKQYNICSGACSNIKHHQPISIISRNYAKHKDKGKGGKKGGKKVLLNNEELSEVINYDKMVKDMDHIIEQLKQDYIKQLSVRSNLGSFETLIVETDDGKFPLKQVAQIIQKSPSLIAINVGAMSQYLPAVKAALEKSGMNINPQQDKTSIFVPLPKVTREHRETLVKAAKTLNDRSKVKLKDVHNKYQKDAKKNADASGDLVHNVIEMIHEKLHDYQNSCDDLMKRKQEELLPAK